MPRVDAELHLTPTQRRLVEWVAQASIGDSLPAPWSMAHDPLESMIRTLADLDVIARPSPDADRAAIARAASVAAGAWFDEHPPGAETMTA